MHATRTTERTAATQWRKSAGLTPTASPSAHRCTKCIIISAKATGERKRGKRVRGNGCTRRCLSAVSLSRAYACIYGAPGLEGEIVAFRRSLLLPCPFFPLSRRLLFQPTPNPLPRCPSLRDGRECAGSFSPLSPLPRVCVCVCVYLLPVGIHPSVRITITQEFYRGRPLPVAH